MASADKNVPIYHVATLDQYFAQSVAEPRFNTLLLSGFAGLAVLLACLGVYGVMSYIVVQRTHEIGVRMALGAEADKVLRWVLGRGFLLSSLGATIGLVVSFGFAHPVIKSALRRACDGCTNFCRRSADTAVRGRTRQLHPRPACSEGRSDDRLTL